MKLQLNKNVIKRLLSLAFVFSLCFAISCTNDDSDNEEDLEIVTPGEGNDLDAGQDIKTDNTMSNY